MTTEVQRALEADTATARNNFTHYTRSSTFSLNLGIKEIRRLQWTGHGPPGQDAEMCALARLVSKGLVENNRHGGVVLSEAGKLVRQLLVLSRHIQPNPEARASQSDVLRVLAHAFNFANSSSPGFGSNPAELRVVNGETQLVIRLIENNGAHSEWTIPLSAARRTG